tara:strand:- start:711 stop:1148 length:438 start_codon:yes stop_codon:yes gene_type:complete
MTTKVENGNNVSVHYKGTLDDGTEFDSSYGRGQPMTFQVGSGTVIPGFDSALEGMAVGETKSIIVLPEKAYGDVNPEALQTIPSTSFPQDMELEVGSSVQTTTPAGQTLTARINTIEESSVILDFNHPLAGKNLNFEIHLIDIQQ